MVASRSIWQDAGEVPETMSKWTMNVDLVQVIQEMGTKQAMFNLNTCGPDDEHFMMRRKDLILAAAPPAAFGWLAAILTLFVNHCIHEVITAMASLGDVKVK